MRHRLVVSIVVVSLVTLALVGCEDLGASDTATSAGGTPTSGAAPTTTPAVATTAQPELVRVPAYQDFPSSYTGNDFGLALEAWQEAIQTGFSEAGLVAEIELVPVDSPQFQEPAAGTMVPRGTVVHIQVIVAD
jgi:hypothetical protein